MSTENRWKTHSLIICLAMLFVACAWTAGHCDELSRFSTLEGNIDIAGGTAHIPVMKDAAQKIMETNPRIRITIAAGGSGVGVQKVGEGLVNIGNTGRPVTKEEIAKYGQDDPPRRESLPASRRFLLGFARVALHDTNRSGGT